MIHRIQFEHTCSYESCTGLPWQLMLFQYTMRYYTAYDGYAWERHV